MSYGQTNQHSSAAKHLTIIHTCGITMGMYNMTSDLNLPSFEYIIEQAKQGVDSLLVVSGGLDSAYIMWKYAQVVTDRPIYLHHIDFYPSHHTRAYAERVALNYQIEYLQRDFKLFNSEVGTSENISLMSDWVLAAMMSVNIAQKYNSSYIVVGDDLPDSYHRGLSFSKINKHKEQMYRLTGELIRVMASGNVDLCTALDTSDLSDAYNEMPSEYIKFTMSCRSPIITGHSIRTCSACHSCHKNQDFGWWDRLDHDMPKPSVDT